MSKYTQTPCPVVSAAQAKRLLEHGGNRIELGQVQVAWRPFVGEDINVTLRFSPATGVVLVDLVIPTDEQVIDTLIDNAKRMAFKEVCQKLGVIHNA